jgi:response regulator RpfG family c-di-GMP phosphodiesterase
MIRELSLVKNLKDTPVIFLTGQSDSISINQAFEANVPQVNYILKPLNFPLVLMTVQKMFLIKEQTLSIKEANESLLLVVKQLKERQKESERFMEMKQALYTSEQERLKDYIKSVMTMVDSTPF